MPILLTTKIRSRLCCDSLTFDLNELSSEVNLRAEEVRHHGQVRPLSPHEQGLIGRQKLQLLFFVFEDNFLLSQR